MTSCLEGPDGWFRRRLARVARIPRGEPSPRARGGDRRAVVAGPVTARPEQRRFWHSIREERDIVNERTGGSSWRSRPLRRHSTSRNQEDAVGRESASGRPIQVAVVVHLLPPCQAPAGGWLRSTGGQPNAAAVRRPWRRLRQCPGRGMRWPQVNEGPAAPGWWAGAQCEFGSAGGSCRRGSSVGQDPTLGAVSIPAAGGKSSGRNGCAAVLGAGSTRSPPGAEPPG